MTAKSKSTAKAALVATGLLLSASTWAQGYPASVSELVARAKAQVNTVDMAAFKSAFDSRSLGLLIDVREPGEYADGHIPGAINIPRGQIEFRIWALVGYPDKLDLATRITLYCASGSRCALAAKSLQDLKFSNVVAADMRIGDWQKAGYPLERN